MYQLDQQIVDKLLITHVSIKLEYGNVCVIGVESACSGAKGLSLPANKATVGNFYLVAYNINNT